MEVYGLNKLSRAINGFVKKVGFDNNDVPLRIALIHSEVSEMFEAYRKDRFCDTDAHKLDIGIIDGTAPFIDFFEENVKDTFEDELADSIIRLLDLAAKRNIDIEFHIQQKMRYNETRGFKFGGKKF